MGKKCLSCEVELILDCCWDMWQKRTILHYSNIFQRKRLPLFEHGSIVKRMVWSRLMIGDWLFFLFRLKVSFEEIFQAAVWRQTKDEIKGILFKV